MNIGKVIGNTVSTVKDPNLKGQRILVVEPLNKREAPFLALDVVGSGAGETVLYTTGREASYAFLPDFVPCNACIVGIVDHIREEKT
ncbi:MAG: EutN/CcmL family microcompartment protein [Acidobacteria bacterium]|nr:EutN/CcmL family microcompartment protein [Acidobacteriota bacterium]